MRGRTISTDVDAIASYAWGAEVFRRAAKIAREAVDNLAVVIDDTR